MGNIIVSLVIIIWQLLQYWTELEYQSETNDERVQQINLEIVQFYRSQIISQFIWNFENRPTFIVSIAVIQVSFFFLLFASFISCPWWDYIHSPASNADSILNIIQPLNLKKTSFKETLQPVEICTRFDDDGGRLLSFGSSENWQYVLLGCRSPFPSALRSQLPTLPSFGEMDDVQHRFVYWQRVKTELSQLQFRFYLLLF